MPQFESMLTVLPQALRDDIRQYWCEFTAALEQQQTPLSLNEPVLEQLVHVWAGSEFTARSCVRNPDMLLQLLASGDLMSAYDRSGHTLRLDEAMAGVDEEAQLSSVLRRYRRREMVRIVWRDLAQLAPLRETLNDLSNLADATIGAALTRLYQWQCENLGTPRDGKGQRQSLIVLGMGKLGGHELNLSSDIDLMFVFPRQGETDGRRAVSNEEFFRRLGQRLIKALHEPTAEGFVFRVDMRLRPFGDSGPLAMPCAAFEDYYQRHGREWERYAMIKARVIRDDQGAGERLLHGLQPFVYRRYLDYGAIESLRSMKEMIAKDVKRKGLQRNIKLGPGGIREIEFIGQAFQLIYGGKEPALRQRSIMPILDYLGESGRLPAEAAVGLKAAYEFLRRTENRLQAWMDQQTHNLPADDIAQLRLAVAMGFPDWETFSHALDRHLTLVSEQFARMFAAPQSKTRSSTELDFTAVWSAVVESEDAARFLTEHGYGDPGKALQSLRHLRQSFSNRSLSQQGRERMDQLVPLLLAAVPQSPQPEETLERITRLLEAIGRRSVYLALLVERPTALHQLVKLCSASIWIAKYLTRHPLLLDDLLDPRTLYSPLDQEHLYQELERELDRIPKEDGEQVLDTLRHFKQSNVLRVATADVSDAIPLMIVSDYLTRIAEVLVRKVVDLAWADLEPRFGRPQCRMNGKELQPGFAVIAYGKLGGIELGYGSDLDLVFLHDSAGEYQQTTGPKEIDNATFFARLTQRVIHMLTARTGAGVLYEVDMRLRPSGRSGLLVSGIHAFAAYQREQAWTWEHQALVRARMVAGPQRLAECFDTIRREVLSQPRDPVELKTEVREMRERMREELGSSKLGLCDIKQDPGGIADIEFMVQYMILAYAQRYPELLTYTDNIRQLDGLEQTGIFQIVDATLLRDAYRVLRRRSHLLKLQEQSSLIPEQELQDYRKEVVRIWRDLMEDSAMS